MICHCRNESVSLHFIFTPCLFECFVFFPSGEIHDQVTNKSIPLFSYEHLGFHLCVIDAVSLSCTVGSYLMRPKVSLIVFVSFQIQYAGAKTVAKIQNITVEYCFHDLTCLNGGSHPPCSLQLF